MSGPRITRKVTVEVSKKVTESGVPSSIVQPSSSSSSSRRSVFERLGPGAVDRPKQRDTYQPDKCRNWLRDGRCPYGNSCKFLHGPFTDPKPRTKSVRSVLQSGSKDRYEDSDDKPYHSRSFDSADYEEDDIREPSKMKKRHKSEEDLSDSSSKKTNKSKKKHKDDPGNDDEEGKTKRKRKTHKKRESSPKGKPLSPEDDDDDEAEEWDAKEGLLKDYQRQVKSDENWKEHGDLDFERQLELERRRQDLQRQLALMDEEDAAASVEEAPGWNTKEKEDDQRKVPIVHSKLHPDPSPSTTGGDTPTQVTKKKKKKKTDPENKKLKVKKEASPRRKEDSKRKVSVSADEEMVIRKEETTSKSKAKKPPGTLAVSSDEADRLDHRQPERDSRKVTRHVTEVLEKESTEPTDSPPRSRVPPDEPTRRRPEEDHTKRKPETKRPKEKRRPEPSADDQTSRHVDESRLFRPRDDNQDHYASPDEQEDGNRRARQRVPTSRRLHPTEAQRVDEGRPDDKARRRDTEEKISSRGPRTPSPPPHTKRTDEHYYYDEQQEDSKKKRVPRAPGSPTMEGQTEGVYRKESRNRPEESHTRGPRTPSDDEGRFSPPQNQPEGGRSNRFSERDRPPPPRRERDVARDRGPEQGDQRYPDRPGRTNVEGDYDKRKPREDDVRDRRPPPRTEDYPRGREPDDSYPKHRNRDDDYPRETREEGVPRNLKRESREDEYNKGKYRDERSEELPPRSRGPPRERNDVEFTPQGRGRGQRDDEGRGRPPQRDGPHRRPHDYPEGHDRDARDDKERPRPDYPDSRNRDRPDERGRDTRYSGAPGADHYRRHSPPQDPPRGRSPTHRYDDRRRSDDNFRAGPGGREAPGRGRGVGRGRGRGGSYGYDNRDKPMDSRRRSPPPPGQRAPYQERDRGPPRGSRDGPVGRGRGYADKSRPPIDRYRDQDAPWDRPRERDYPPRDHRKPFEEPAGRERRMRDASPPPPPPPQVYREERPWEERDRREGPPSRSGSIPVQERRTPYESDHDGKGRVEHRERHSLDRGAQEWEYDEGATQEKPLRKRPRPPVARSESPFEAKKPRAQSPISPDEGPEAEDVTMETEEAVKPKKTATVAKDVKKIKKKKKEGKILKAIVVQGATEAVTVAAGAGAEDGKIVKGEKKLKKEKKLKEKGAKKKKKVLPAASAPPEPPTGAEDTQEEPPVGVGQGTPPPPEKPASPKLGKKRKQDVGVETESGKETEKPVKKKKKKKHQPEVLVQPWNDLEGEDEQDEVKADDKPQTEQSNEEKSSEVVQTETKQDEMFSDWSDDDSPVGDDSWPDEDSQKSANQPGTKVDPAVKDSPISDAEKAPSFDDVYDPISDDEFEAMYTQSDEEDAKKDDEETASKALGIEDVDWSSLGISQDLNKEKEPVSNLEKFKPAYIFSRIGISPTLAGQRLTQLVQEACAKRKTNETQKEEPGTELFVPEEGPKCIGAFVAAAAAKKRDREGLLGNLGPCRRALCARRDLAIRKQLGRSSKFCKMALFAAAPATPVDNELFQMSVALYKKEPNDNGVRIVPSRVGSILLTQA